MQEGTNHRKIWEHGIPERGKSDCKSPVVRVSFARSTGWGSVGLNNLPSYPPRRGKGRYFNPGFLPLNMVCLSFQHREGVRKEKWVQMRWGGIYAVFSPTRAKSACVLLTIRRTVNSWLPLGLPTSLARLSCQGPPALRAPSISPFQFLLHLQQGRTNYFYNLHFFSDYNTCSL